MANYDNFIKAKKAGRVGEDLASEILTSLGYCLEEFATDSIDGGCA